MIGSSVKITETLEQLLAEAKILEGRFETVGTPSTVKDGQLVHTMIVGIRTLLILDERLRKEVEQIGQITDDIYYKTL